MREYFYIEMRSKNFVTFTTDLISWCIIYNRFNFMNYMPTSRRFCTGKSVYSLREMLINVESTFSIQISTIFSVALIKMTCNRWLFLSIKRFLKLVFMVLWDYIKSTKFVLLSLSDSYYFFTVLSNRLFLCFLVCLFIYHIVLIYLNMEGKSKDQPQGLFPVLSIWSVFHLYWYCL